MRVKSSQKTALKSTADLSPEVKSRAKEAMLKEARSWHRSQESSKTAVDRFTTEGRVNRTHSVGLKRENKIHRLDMEARSKFKMAVLESDARRPGCGLE